MYLRIRASEAMSGERNDIASSGQNEIKNASSLYLRVDKTYRTGFKDLPLELRQEIYSYSLPEARKTFLSGRRGEKNVFVMCAIKPDSGEAMDVIYSECSVHIIIQPELVTDFL